MLKLEGHTSFTRAIAFSPDGKLLGTCSEDGTVRVWDTTDATCLLTASLHEPSLRPRPEQEATDWPLQNVEDYDQEWISGDSNGDSKGTPRGDLCVGYFMLSESACTGRVGRSNAGVGTGDIRGE